MQKIYLSVMALLVSAGLFAQPVIYNDAQTLITGSWTGAGAGGSATLAEVTGQTPHEGTKHYRFDYNYTEWWAGMGLNMDNWGTGPARDLSGFTHLRIAFRGLAAGQTLSIQLRNGSNYGNQMEVGTSNSVYTVVDIPMISLLVGSPVSANAVREIDLSISAPAQTGSGILYFDAVQMVNTVGGPTPASATTMARAAALGTGLNATNWLEAYWLMPFNAYPEFNKFTRTKIRDLHDAGFGTFRLPVTFERLGSQTPPYDLNFSHVAFDLVDSMILWAGIYNFKLIIDNHHGYPLTDANFNTELPRLQAVWEQLTNHYDYLDASQFFFEIYNEPTNEISNANWRTVAASLISTIRANESQTHSVLVGANQWNSGSTLIGFTPLSDPDIIYTFHNYDPYFFTHQGMSWTSPPYFPARAFPLAGEVAAINQLFASVKSWGDSYAVPVNLGEFGCSTEADATSRCNWIQTLTTAINTNGMSAFYWDATSTSDGFGFYTNGIINESNCIPCFKTALGLYAALPVSLIEFETDCENGQTAVRWEATTSGDGYLMDVERSTDNTQWNILKRINAVEGVQQYLQLDPAPGNYRFYRLKITSPDLKVTYSPVREITCTSQDTRITVNPNPASSQSTVTLEGDGTITHIDLYDVAGKLVSTQIFEAGAQVKTHDISLKKLPAGMYWVSVTAGSGEKKVIKLEIIK